MKASPYDILITVPDLSQPGGVASLYNILDLDGKEGVSYFDVHSGARRSGMARYLQLLSCFRDFYRQAGKVNVVHINPSLDKKSFIRDGIFAGLSRRRKKKVLVYWHGWKEPFEQKLRASGWMRFFFKHTFGKADRHIVLGRIFEQKLSALGIDREKIRVGRNAADDSGVAISYRKQFEGLPFHVLYLSRIEKDKGIYIAIDAVKALREQCDVRLVIAGSGSEEQAAKALVAEQSLGHIRFAGYVTGTEKDALLKAADLLLLPSLSEGMPISILEGMLYGLPVVSSPVGGIPDWITNGENGILVDDWNAHEYSVAIGTLANDPQTCSRMSANNRQRALESFTPQAVREWLFTNYKEIAG
ncbi:glycosyltransferase family 4 protein [Taibaiella koreensis]|uniref:glycosyltransferase family 4 protein n=1 Tax=Taibaiella koreensis TaxID=1268548 RepID=UPI000E599298|nr:glycosyltransferase family 4 protein [Taibaiella koreensis]